MRALRGLLGGAAGLGLAWLLVRGATALLGPSGAVERARELGLVSFTVLRGYDEAQEPRAWLLLCLLVPLAAGLAASGGRRRSAADWPSWSLWAVPGAAVLGVALRGVLWGHPPWGSFGFLAEEGVYLGAVQGLRTGRTLYADLEFPYGPWLLLPMHAWLGVAGPSVVAARGVVLVGHGLGVLALGAAAGLVAGRRAAVLAAVLAAALAPIGLPTLNSVLLRPALALVPGALAVWAWPRPRRGVWAGAAAAGAALVSFEVGAAAAAGVLAAGSLRPRLLAWAALGGSVTGGLGVLPLGWRSLAAMPEQASRMLSLPALGYQALPYPDPLGFFRDADGRWGAFPPGSWTEGLWAVTPPLVIWAAAAAGLAGLRWGGADGAGERAESWWPRPDGAAGLLVLCIAAAALYRGALGRSDLYHCWFYGAPALAVLGGVLLSRAPGWAVLLLPLLWADPGGSIAFPDDEELRLARAAGIASPLQDRPVQAPRTGVRLRPRLAAQVEAVVARVAELPMEDGVWFHPSEATYAFLADRPLPHRFLWAYDAATPALQAQAVAELRSDPPRWVVRSTDTFPIDWIPPEQLAPGIEAFIAEHYEPVEDLPGAQLLRWSP